MDSDSDCNAKKLQLSPRGSSVGKLRIIRENTVDSENDCKHEWRCVKQHIYIYIEREREIEKNSVLKGNWIILIIAINLIILSVSLTLSLIIRHCFSKLKKDRRTKLHKNVERSGMVVTDQEKRPEQQIELKPILLYMYVYVTAKISYRHLTLG